MKARTAASRSRRYSIIPHWISKTLAGGLAGLSLPFALLGIATWLSPEGVQPGDKTQVVMWLVPPVWMFIFSLSYLFRSGWHAWGWLGGANLLAYAALFAIQQGIGR